jgi:hypothetical protein
MNNLPKNVSAFVAEFTAGMSAPQHAAFWKKFRKAANAYADTQAKRICDLEAQVAALKKALHGCRDDSLTLLSVSGVAEAQEIAMRINKADEVLGLPQDVIFIPAFNPAFIPAL